MVTIIVFVVTVIVTYELSPFNHLTCNINRQIKRAKINENFGIDC